jgi:uncharacterized RDD family membrane protein YckC
MGLLTSGWELWLLLQTSLLGVYCLATGYERIFSFLHRRSTVSILPPPDLTPETPPTPASDAVRPTEGIHFSTLDAYAGQPGALPGVSFWPRAGARVIDLVTHYFLAFCSAFLFGVLLAFVAALLHTSSHVPIAHRKLTGGALFVFALLGSFAFETVCKAVHGSTPGKRLLSMVVVQEDGSPCRFGSACIRELAYFIDSLFFGLIGYFNMQKNPQQQRHGDEWAHTIVCHRSDVAPQNLRGDGQFMLAAFVATLAYVALFIVGMLINLLA